jgi:S-adenosylmethionine:tRNA ribosyltransferase-isomerase
VTSPFSFELPEELIAKRPLDDRSASRLLHVPATGDVGHRRMRELPALLREGDVVVVNDTTVIPARLFGEKAGTGGKVEVLLVRRHEEQARTWVCLINASKKPKPGTRLVFGTTTGGAPHSMDAFFATVDDAVEDEPGSFLVTFDGDALAFARHYGHVPLPPYMQRDDDDDDIERYQTIYHDDNKPGSCAAPTAGLHFDDALLDAVRAQGAKIARVTLHVGPGTFLPMRGSIDEHVMHPEPWIVDANAAELINDAKRAGKRVIAVGTTSLRCLESATVDGKLRAGSGLTRLFIKPGYSFKSVDALVTNFHLPDSTLFVLVCALAGTERMQAAYAEAIRERYRFYSYGDACFLERAA